jgi:phage terminase small subunit
MATRPALTARQAAFCRLLAEGRSNRDAYLQAGYRVAPETADANASRLLLRNARVAAMVRALQAQAAQKVEVTVEGQ